MNKMNTVAKPSPPKPVPRKDTEVNKAFEDKAKALVRQAMTDQGVTVPELAKRLADIGVDMSAGGVANKISRGGFSSAFLLQCMEALEVDIETHPKSEKK